MKDDSVATQQAEEQTESKAPEVGVTENQDAKKPSDKEKFEEKTGITYFDKEDMVNEKGGKINVILDELYEACKEEGLPCAAFINYKVTDAGDGYACELRGMRVNNGNGFMPPMLQAIISVSENDTLADVVRVMSSDPKALMLMKLLDMAD